MPSVSAFFLIALSAIAVEATNVNGDPTDLANWPPCAQKCIPIGLNAPTSCGSLSNLTCICREPAFTLAIVNCEETTCSTEELQQIAALSTPLCAPVNGQPASVSAELGTYLATASLAPSSLASYPATATGSSAISAILATATPETSGGNPSDLSSYPLCAQTCFNESIPLVDCDPANDVNCACGATFRSASAACEEVICSSNDRAAIAALAEQLCGPVYQNMPSLGSAVSSAIASATSVAASVATLDPTKITSYPLCAQTCQNATIPASGCGSLSNRTCICTNPELNTNVGTCELATCSASDIQITMNLVEGLCASVPGFGSNPSNASVSSNMSSSTPATTSPIAFAGDASPVMERSVGLVAMGLVGVLGWQLLL